MNLSIAAVRAASPNPQVGKVDRGFLRQDEPVFLSSHTAGPDAPFATLDDAIAGAAYMSQTGNVTSSFRDQPGSTFVIRKAGDAFEAVRLLQPVWKRTLGNERIEDLTALTIDDAALDGKGGLDVRFDVVHQGSYGYGTRRHEATGTLKLDASLGQLAIVGNGWAFQDGTLRTVEGSDPYPPAPPPPPPPPPPPLGPELRDAIDRINTSIELINTVPVTDKGDASTKDARIAAYNANMSAQDVLERNFLLDGQAPEVVSQLRTADAHLEDANWQLAKKPSPDGRFNGVDIPGALRDSHAAVDVLQTLLAAQPAEG
jgi:hypothetical protein